MIEQTIVLVLEAIYEGLERGLLTQDGAIGAIEYRAQAHLGRLCLAFRVILDNKALIAELGTGGSSLHNFTELPRLPGCMLNPFA